jgi:hypothetical protein
MSAPDAASPGRSFASLLFGDRQPLLPQSGCSRTSSFVLRSRADLAQTEREIGRVVDGIARGTLTEDDVPLMPAVILPRTIRVDSAMSESWPLRIVSATIARALR